MHVVRVLCLPESPPTIGYRPWAPGEDGFSILRWYVERLTRRHGAHSLIVAYRDEADRARAEAVCSGLDPFVARLPGKSLLEGLGDVAEAFAGAVIAYFHLESLFAPSDLLDRVVAHHAQRQNDYTAVAGLPQLLAPEVANAAFLAELARVYRGGAAPSPGEAAARLARLRQNGRADTQIRSEPFAAARAWPELAGVSALCSRDDADRARQVLEALPEQYGFEAVERWAATAFQPPSFPLPTPRPSHPERPAVLYLSVGSYYSGAEECLRTLAWGLRELDFDQTAAVGVEGLLSQRLREAGCRVAAANWNFANLSRNCADANRRFANEVLDCVRPDCIHCNTHPGEAFLQAASERGIPVVTHVRSCVVEPVRDLYSASDRLIAVSEFIRRRLIASGMPAADIHVVYDGVDPARFSPGVFDKMEMRRRFDLPPHAFVVLMIARPAAQKRHDLMLDAFAGLGRDGREVRLVFVGGCGGDSWLRAMQTKARALQLDREVLWLPFQEDIRRIECASDVVALPSDEEALGTCILEAMSLEIPVVVSRNGGTHELIQDRISGISVPGNDASALAAALGELSRSPDLRARLGSEARRRVQQRFTPRIHAEQVAQVFRNARRREHP